MSQNYASNADSVKDFVNNYTDEQIQGMEDMTSSANTQLSLKWRAEFDQAHAKALEEGTLAGESLGGLLGVKGLYKGATGGYKKLKDIYNKGKEVEKKAKELRDKLQGKKKKEGEEEDEDEFEGFGEDDLEDTDGKIPSNSKGDTGEEGDQDSSEKTPDFNDDDLTRGEARQQRGEDDDEDDFEDLGDDDFDPQGALSDLRKTLNEGDDAEGDLAGDLEDTAPTAEELGSLFTGLKGSVSAMRKKLQEETGDDDELGDDVGKDIDDFEDFSEGQLTDFLKKKGYFDDTEDEDESGDLDRQDLSEGDYDPLGALGKTSNLGETDMGGNPGGQTPSRPQLQEGDDPDASDTRGGDDADEFGDDAEQDLGELGDEGGAGVLNTYAGNIASRVAARGASIRNVTKSAYKYLTRYSDGSVKKGSEDADDDDEDKGDDVGDDLGDDLGTDLGADLGEEAGSLGLDLAIGAVPVLGEVAAVGFGLYEGFKSVFDIFDPSTPTPPKPKVIGSTISGGNPLNIGQDSGIASKLTSGIPTMDDVQDVSSSLSF